MTDKAERDARAALFGRIEREVLPAAEKRAASVAPFAVEGVEFGSRPAQKAFGADGELRFEVGRWNGSRFEQIAERVLFPIRPPEMGVEYPADVFYVPGISGVFAHYTPVTRRLDYFEVWHYFLLARAKEADVRQKAFGLLEARIAKSHPAAKVSTSARFVPYAEFYAVVTEVLSRDLYAAGEAERRAIGRLI